MRLAAILTIVALGAACGVEHRSAAYGVAYRASMAMQTKPAATPPAPTNPALDTQEANVIAVGYVRGLAPKGKQDAGSEPVIYVAPAPRAGTAPPLLPSVPGN